MTKQTREDLVRLVKHIMTSSGCVIDLDGLINQFESAVPYPNAGELIFNPPSGRKLTAEEIVDIACDRESENGHA